MSHGKSGGVSLRHYPTGAPCLWVSPEGMQGLRPPWCYAKEHPAQPFSVAHLPVFGYISDASGLRVAAMHQPWSGAEALAFRLCFALPWAVHLLSM